MDLCLVTALSYSKFILKYLGRIWTFKVPLQAKVKMSKKQQCVINRFFSFLIIGTYNIKITIVDFY
jgi:hypothetical protein